MAKAAVIESNEQSTAVQRAASGPQRLMEFLKETREEMRTVDDHCGGGDGVFVCGLF
jgi:preprotein translocase subunit SecE